MYFPLQTLSNTARMSAWARSSWWGDRPRSPRTSWWRRGGRCPAPGTCTPPRNCPRRSCSASHTWDLDICNMSKNILSYFPMFNVQMNRLKSLPLHQSWRCPRHSGFCTVFWNGIILLLLIVSEATRPKYLLDPSKHGSNNHPPTLSYLYSTYSVQLRSVSLNPPPAKLGWSVSRFRPNECSCITLLYDYDPRPQISNNLWIAVIEYWPKPRDLAASKNDVTL